MYEFPVLQRLFAEIRNRDATAVASCFTEDAYYVTCVPRSEHRGRSTIESMFAKVLGSADRVEWEVANSAYVRESAWLERIDRFWFDESEVVIECLGVFEIDNESQLFRGVRDYCDIETWNKRNHAARRH